MMRSSFRPSARLVVLAAFLVAVGLLASEPSPADTPTIPDPSAAVVKVYVAAMEPMVWTPWRAGYSTNRTGSGAVIEGGRILTNAHVVRGHTYVQVRPNGGSETCPATVAFVSHVADLALLEVECAGFAEQVQTLPLGALPSVQDPVAAYGFPNGGDTLSITAGVVSRVEHESYAHGKESLLAIQMDAAIAPGSSGGPVVSEGALVGIAMQTFGERSIGSAVPVPLVRQFLDDVADGTYDGIPALGIRMQTLGSDALRASLGMPGDESGVLVTGVTSDHSAEGILQPGDVVLALDGVDVGNDGTVEFRGRERTSLSHVTDLQQVGDSVTIRYLRGSEVREGHARLTRVRGQGALVPRLYDHAAEYYVFGGLAFVALSMDFVDSVRSVSAGTLSEEIVGHLARDRQSADEEVVYLADVLTGSINVGYDSQRYLVLESVDGQPVRNLTHLVELAEKGDGPFVTFEFGRGRRITLDRERGREETSGLLARYGLPFDRSPSLLGKTGFIRTPEKADAAATPGEATLTPVARSSSSPGESSQ